MICMPGVTFVDFSAMSVRRLISMPGEISTYSDASPGSFTTRCGVNANKHFNPDNFIVNPGVSDGAQHTHDYVGNLTTNGFSTNDSLQAGTNRRTV